MQQERTEEHALQVIVGEQLSAITFVQDYVQLHFDGPCLTAFSRPVVMLDSKTFRWGEPCFCDALCGRIAKKVLEAHIAYGESLAIKFEDGSIIQVSLQDEDYVGGEAVKFDAQDAEWWVL
jgi:hypothetical protein